MKMQLFEPLRLKFEQADWLRNLELRLFDTILDHHTELLKIVSDDLLDGTRYITLIINNITVLNKSFDQRFIKSSLVSKTKNFDLPVQKKRSGEYVFSLSIPLIF